MRGIGRADDFAVARAGLRDSRDVGLALLGGEVGEVGNVLIPLAGSGPVVVAGDVEVGLDEDGGSEVGDLLCGERQSHCQRNTTKIPAKARSPRAPRYCAFYRSASEIGKPMPR